MASVVVADDKTRNSGIPHRIYSRFYIIVTSSCTSRVGVCCCLLSLSMDNSTVLGFPDTSGDYRSLVSKYRTPAVHAGDAVQIVQIVQIVDGGPGCHCLQ